jgi:hypothetical protein
MIKKKHAFLKETPPRKTINSFLSICGRPISFEDYLNSQTCSTSFGGKNHHPVRARLKKKEGKILCAGNQFFR